MKARHSIYLEWVVVDGADRRVSDFAHLPPGSRPKVSCKVCDERLVLKLGRKVVHHAAHRPGSHCALRAGESIVHFNTKMHLAAELSRSTTLLVTHGCSGAATRGCLATETREWIQGWDRVEVEFAVASRRPDVLLLRGNEAIGAIEVCVSHAVPPEKREDLMRSGLDWVETQGTPDLYAPDGWTAELPLTILTSAASWEQSWECPACADDRHEAERERARIAASEQQAREVREALLDELFDAVRAVHEHGFTARAFRLVDLYYSGNKKYRERFFVIERRAGGRALDLRVVAGRHVNKAIGRLDPGDPRNREHADAMVNRYLDRFRRSAKEIDGPMKWAMFLRPAELTRDDLAALEEYGLLAKWSEETDAWDSSGPTMSHVVLSDFLVDTVSGSLPRRCTWHWASRRWFASREQRDLTWDLSDWPRFWT